MADQRGLLASPQLDGQPVKGVYFFPGESSGNLDLYTTHPLFDDDKHWNSDPSCRTRVIDRIVAAHVNTLVMSYWSNMPQWSPMALDGGSLSGVLDAVQGRPIVVMPAIEGGLDPKNPDIPHWQFQSDFLSPHPEGPTGPGLIERIGMLVELFDGRMELWARMYDRNGDWRYAIQILHVCSDIRTNDNSFAQGFAAVANVVQELYQIPIGFTLDVIQGNFAYVATAAGAGACLEREPAVLALHGFASEVFSGRVICAPHDNNMDNLVNMADWKWGAVRDWTRTGIPMILDVTNGMDGRIVWKDGGLGFWGDNMDYTDDRWRNWMSEFKGPWINGITMDTWNGYTEGYAAAPSREHCLTVYQWLADLLEPDPRAFSHMHYVHGAATFRVYGAICEKWIQLGGDRGFGPPTTSELQGMRGRVSFFTDGELAKAIYWSPDTEAHEVHGLIAKTYWEEARGDWGPLGLPVTDEQPNGVGGRVSFFEHGRIDWSPGDALGRTTYY